MIEHVVPILQVGLSGLAFLLAFLAYRIIAREQRASSPKASVLKAARSFLFQCIILALMVGIFQVILKYFPNSQPLDSEQIARCRDSMDLLLERKKRATELIHLKDAIGEHKSSCQEILRQLDFK